MSFRNRHLSFKRKVKHLIVGPAVLEAWPPGILECLLHHVLGNMICFQLNLHMRPNIWPTDTANINCRRASPKSGQPPVSTRPEINSLGSRRQTFSGVSQRYRNSQDSTPTLVCHKAN